jgi:predicted permease
MADEMRLHVELQAELNRRAGMDGEEARFAALRQFGNVAEFQQRVRENRGWAWRERLSSDWRHAWRTLAKSPLQSAVIVLSLGIGVGVNAVIFSWIRALTFRPLPHVVDASSIRLVEPRTDTGSHPGASWQEYRDLQPRVPSFRDLVAFRMVPLNLGENGRDERVHAQFVSGNYFSALGLEPAAGRLLRPDETSRAGGAAVAVISHDFWQNRYGGSPEAVGRTLRLNDQIVTIVGVAPEGFLGTVVGLGFDLWVPATMAPVLLPGSTELEARDVRGFSLMGLLAPGASESRARTEVDAAMGQLASMYPASNASIKADVLAFWRAPRGAPKFILGGLAALQGFMLLVLFMVCANAASLMLARATARRREIGVRLALGARPRQILRLFLTESVLLGLLASALGVLLAVWGANGLRAVPLPGAFPFKFQTDLDGTGLLVTVSLGAACGLIFGLAPAWQSARTDSQLALRTAGQAPGRNRVRGALVAVEVALALLVLMTAAVFLRSFQESRSADTGFAPKGVVLAAYDLSGRGYDKARGLALMDEVVRRLASAPGIEGAAIASWVPLDFHAMPVAGFNVDGQARSDGGLERALTYSVTPGYFGVMGIPLTAGHDFAALSDTATRPQAIVNEEFVRRFLDGKLPLGRRVVGRTTFEIVGVVRNSLYESFGESPKPIVYFSYRDRFSQSGQIHVRTRAADSAAAPDLRRIMHEINPAITLYDVRTLAEHVDKNLFFRRIPARMFAVLGPLVLVLAAIGIYAVVAHAVAQRTIEIGVRRALGATDRTVVWGMVRESMRGVLMGAIPAWLVAAIVALHVGGSGAATPGVLLGVPALLLGVALLASWWPARRAAQVDPLIALRAE